MTTIQKQKFVPREKTSFSPEERVKFVPGNLIRLNEQNRNFRYNHGHSDLCFLVLLWRRKPGLSMCRSKWNFDTNEYGNSEHGWQILDQDGALGWLSEDNINIYEIIQ